MAAPAGVEFGFGDAIGLSATLIGLISALYGACRLMLRSWHRTIGSRRILTRQLDGLACGVTVDYLHARLGPPAFQRRIADLTELTWRLPHAWPAP